MTRSRIVSAVLLCLVLLSLLACGDSASTHRGYEGAVATARSEIWKAINSGKCGSATAAIMLDGRVVYAEGFGMADRERGIPVDRSTLFNIGSISKVYVATAVMLLVDDGLVSLDEPVTTYIPDFRMADGRYRRITVRMLLNHTSGMPGTQALNSFGYRYDDRVKQQTLDTLASGHLKHEPGGMAVYCNDGFTLAEIIVERMSGMKYIDFLYERVFRPMGLGNTGPSVGQIQGKPVALYYDPKTGKPMPLEALSILGAGGLSATAEDVSRFFVEAFSSEGNLLKRASVEEMKKPQPSAFWGRLRNPSISYGLGWDMTSLPRYEAAGIQVLGKSGGTGNYSSMVYTVPERKISVAVIASGPESGAMTIALDILDALLVERQLISKEERPVQVPPVAQTLPPDAASFSGYYASGSLVQMVVDAEKDTVTLYSIEGQEKTPTMTLVYSDGYYCNASGGRFYFASFGGESYMVTHLPALRIDMISMQKVRPMENPGSLRIDMADKVWLRRNIPATESALLVDWHHVKSLLYADLPGYVYFNGVKRISSPEFAGMPFDAIRDQSELTLFERDGATWARISDLLYSPVDTAAPLKAGENSVTIGGEGYNEWLVAEEDAVLSPSMPQDGRLIVLSPDGEAVYDSSIDSGPVYAAKGSYIEAAGVAGDIFTIRAAPR